MSPIRSSRQGWGAFMCYHRHAHAAGVRFWRRFASQCQWEASTVHSFRQLRSLEGLTPRLHRKIYRRISKPATDTRELMCPVAAVWWSRRWRTCAEVAVTGIGTKPATQTLFSACSNRRCTSVCVEPPALSRHLLPLLPFAARLAAQDCTKTLPESSKMLVQGS